MTATAVPARLHAMHDARTLARLAGAPAAPLCATIAMPLAAPGRPLGCFVEGNLLSPDFAFDAELPGQWIFTWSGTLAADLASVSPANWMRGPQTLAAACDSLAPQLARHRRRLLLVPHARHILSDARSALTWWCERVIPGQDPAVVRTAPAGERAFGLALDPGAMLEPSMLADAPDHLRSLVTHVGARADAIILRDMAPSAQDPELLAPCSAGTGALPGALLWELVREAVPETVPVLVPGGGLDRTLAWLGVR
ncbi:MAG: hypothetical protein U0625_03640 [Phycisphaerales bacterium]